MREFFEKKSPPFLRGFKMIYNKMMENIKKEEYMCGYKTGHRLVVVMMVMMFGRRKFYVAMLFMAVLALFFKLERRVSYAVFS